MDMKVEHDHSLSIVIPVYNGEETLQPLIARLWDLLPILTTQYEVILVNDGSHDRSWEVIADLTTTNLWVHGINLMRNYGQHNALLAGIRNASNSIIVTMDDDLQNPPEEIPLLLAKLQEGFDVVYGTPIKQQHGLWRAFASSLTKLALQEVLGTQTARSVSAFRAFRTQLRDSFATYQGPYVSIDVLLTWATARFSAVPVRNDPRFAGESNYTFRKLVSHAINMMTGFSTWPLKVASLIGFTFTLFGIGVLIYVIGRFLISGYSIAGLPFLASIIAIFSGAQLFALGIIGEYLARMHFRSMDRPTYVIRNSTDKGKS